MKILLSFLQRTSVFFISITCYSVLVYGQGQDCQVQDDLVIIIDDMDAGVIKVGKWIESNAKKLHGQSALKGKNKKKKTSQITFPAELPEPGTYRVAVWNPRQSKASSRASHVVTHVGGETEVLVNQKENRGAWIDLGDFDFTSVAAVTISTEKDFQPNLGIPKKERNLNVNADAVRFTLIERDCTPFCGVSIKLNEASSSNTVFLDEDGESSDWFELYNAGELAVDLADWTVTDDKDEADKWTFPSVEIQPGEYLLIRASDEDRKNLGQYRTLVNQGHIFRYIWPFGPIGQDWVLKDFDDAGWTEGPSGIGYGDGDDATLISEDARAVYARTSFEVNAPSQIETLWLDIDYDDAFIAYINGVEVARANIGGEHPDFDATPFDWHEALMYVGGYPERFEIVNPDLLLQAGANTLSIQVHNISDTSSDLTLIPFLTAKYDGASNDGIATPAILRFQNDNLYTNFKLSSKGETLYLHLPSGELHDSLAVEGVVTDVSVGRSVNDYESIAYYAEPTPGTANTTTEYLGVVTSKLDFSDDGGSFTGQSVSLEGAETEETIRYTLDASVPTESAAIYAEPIMAGSNTVVRARIFRPGYIPSRVQTRTYLPGVSHDLPIVVLVTEPDNFFNQQTGIYVFGSSFEPQIPYFGANFWQDWEREIHFSFYEPDGELGVAIDAGTKIFGSRSRSNAQRSLSIFARGRYGFSELDYPLFPDLEYDEFQAVVLRNAGNDWHASMLRDGVMTSLMADSGLDYQAYRPVVSYLNGEYWGVYNLREKVNEHFIDSKHDIDKDELDLLEFDGSVIEGSNLEYKALIHFIRNHDLSDPNHFATVAEQIDIDNFIRYQVAQIYFDNQDWPGNNIKFWKTPETKWRWVLFDTDFGFGLFGDSHYQRDTLSFALFSDGTGWPNPAWSTLLLRKLVENPEFQTQFVNQFADDFNSRFTPSSVLARIDEYAQQIESEIPRQFNRWDGNLNDWSFHLNRMRDFANHRIDYLRGYIKARFGLTGSSAVVITNLSPDKGSIKLNSLVLNDAAWLGEYFHSVPIRLEAQPKQAHRFACWRVDDDIQFETTMELMITEDTQVDAVFTDVTDPAMPSACMMLGE